MGFLEALRRRARAEVVHRLFRGHAGPRTLAAAKAFRPAGLRRRQRFASSRRIGCPYVAGDRAALGAGAQPQKRCTLALQAFCRHMAPNTPNPETPHRAPEWLPKSPERTRLAQTIRIVSKMAQSGPMMAPGGPIWRQGVPKLPPPAPLPALARLCPRFCGPKWLQHFPKNAAREHREIAPAAPAVRVRTFCGPEQVTKTHPDGLGIFHDDAKTSRDGIKALLVSAACGGSHLNLF